MAMDDRPRAGPVVDDELTSLVLNGMPWAWDLDAGNLTLFGHQAVAFGALSSLEPLIGPLRAELGDDLFRLLIALSSGRGTRTYYETWISEAGATFAEGFLAWGEAVAAAGWGRFTMPLFDRESCTAIVRVDNPWELQLQTGDDDWGCPFLQGKLIGLFSAAFGVSCWAYEDDIYREGEQSAVEFRIVRSDRTIEHELARLRAAHQRERDGELAREVERKTAALRESEARQRAILLSISDLVLTVDTALTIDDYFPPSTDAEAFPARDDSLGLPVEAVFGPTLIPDLRALASGEQHQTGHREFELALDGALRTYEAQFAPRTRDGGELDGLTVVVRDVTRQRAVEAQLWQAQKMEALGQLASGVSHDFNNLLTAIMNATDLLALQAPASLLPLTETILDASQTAGGLIRKLLDVSRSRSGSRSGQIREATIDVHAIIATAVGLLEASVGRGVRVIVEAHAGEHRIRGDADQLQSALLNLGVNARDAMPAAGGEIRIVTRNIELDAETCAHAHAELTPGPYVEVEFSDDGEGMGALTQARAFEPFFTTKAPGKGTGLGLAAVYGAARDHGGDVTITSSPGQGATFRLRFPLAELEPPAT